MAEAGACIVVLASASPFRRRMLEAAGVALTVAPADVDEPALRQALAGAGPADVAVALAAAKAEAVSARMPSALVIGADQVLSLGMSILSKPRDLSEARRQLLELRGRTHELPTGVALALAGRVIWRHVDTPRLTMRAFSEAFLDRYLEDEGESVCQSVGAYKIEGRGVQLFERIEGDTFSIIGLPLVALLGELRRQGALPA